MSSKVDKIVATSSVVAISAAIAWLGGWDFNTRGFGPAYWFICTVFAA